MNAKKSGSSTGYELGRVERRHNDLIAAKERKEVKISADYTDCADYGFGRMAVVSDAGRILVSAVHGFLWKAFISALPQPEICVICVICG
jgi:hypothetical protein